MWTSIILHTATAHDYCTRLLHTATAHVALDKCHTLGSQAYGENS